MFFALCHSVCNDKSLQPNGLGTPPGNSHARALLFDLGSKPQSGGQWSAPKVEEKWGAHCSVCVPCFFGVIEKSRTGEPFVRSRLHGALFHAKWSGGAGGNHSDGQVVPAVCHVILQVWSANADWWCCCHWHTAKVSRPWRDSTSPGEGYLQPTLPWDIVFLVHATWPGWCICWSTIKGSISNHGKSGPMFFLISSQGM